MKYPSHIYIYLSNLQCIFCTKSFQKCAIRVAWGWRWELGVRCVRIYMSMFSLLLSFHVIFGQNYAFRCIPSLQVPSSLRFHSIFSSLFVLVYKLHSIWLKKRRFEESISSNYKLQWSICNTIFAFESDENITCPYSRSNK